MEDHLLVNKIETTIEMLKVHNLNLNNVKTMVKKDHLLDAMTVDKIFRIHNFSEAKKVAMPSLEFEGYANVWWEEVNMKRAKEDLEPIDTWEEMQEVMHTRFVPTHHKRDLYNKLTQLKQSFKSVEEYYKEMHMTMMSANVDEREEQTMERFLNGLNIPIKSIVEFLTYKNMVELLHQATRAERQVREDLASAKSKNFFAARNATNSSSSIKNTSASASKDPPKQTRSAIKTTSFEPELSTMSSKASTGSSNITCFKCDAQGHKSFECKNTRVMITRDDGDVEYLSEDVFPDELPHGLPPLRGIEHHIDLIPGALLPNRAAYRTNPEDTKEIQRQIQDLLEKGYVRESLSPCIDSIAADLKDQKMTVIGDMDTVTIAKRLRKFGRIDILSVGPAKEEKKDDKKGDKK
ncbi:hypothetical protein QYE76_045208 [Lolium multiflorum]|uniref:CCHC-type domain-containing protein n=1 Tax=Lolium multiflorum TaxID=4521 RepID=A0AAD8WXG0_LOLMU|nr:hypothetical protein QYE76_045208 [Lolium multiflorum]